MLFSVVIPTYNRAAMLQRALESVWGQEFSDYEVIIVDDGSTDTTAEYLRSLGGRARVFMQANHGPGAARNLGATEARGQYVAFLDSDDLWFPWTLAVFAEAIALYQRPAIIVSRQMPFAEEHELDAVTRQRLRAEAFTDYLASSHEDYAVGAGMVAVRRDYFLESEGFVERRINAEDNDLSLRLGTAPGFVQLHEPVMLGVRRHPSSMTLDLTLGLEGQRHLLASERAGRYPGGITRRRERWRLLAKQARPIAVALLRRGRAREAWQIYRETFRWQFTLGRWKFLIGFPLLGFAGSFRRREAWRGGN
jgi:glycosyltransferase involved in cell wall biosynthesis